ncbi:non-canonical purine NTP phosphatase [Pseudovibrio japonicus]|uniref:Inosine/xanthosine triphosphatase n=1 Tax=Pseudovibrio japonicus TaxID=366534 RepID=A0ABQ3EH92_9HYPH|nr:inosine/xanthosine triphosphatase [Pseudovibrio japonicus]GHB36955.1 non-canonical purine NTP phosphatase [Pseudovibrio japonicus]
MKIVVASQNPVKVNATLEAFRAQFPADEIELVSATVPSGVPDQPMSDEETHQGAVMRAQNALEAEADADFGVGLEGGICVMHGMAYTFAWMVVVSREGQVSASRSMLLPLPEKVMHLIRSGMELGHAIDEIYGTDNIKQKGGAVGLLTGGRLTRTSTYVDTLYLALLPFRSPAFLDA